MRKVLKWLGYILGGLIGLVIVALIALYAITQPQINKTYENVPADPIAIPTDEASIERGHHLVTTILFCRECHGADLGGKEFVNDLLTGTIWTVNLTTGKGGFGSKHTDADYIRAIRHGIAPNNKSVIAMPADYFNNISDKDLGAVIAYIKSLPPVDRETPPPSLGPIGRVYILLRPQFVLPASHIDHFAPRPPEPVPGPTADYGKYLALACRNCHGEGLVGQPPDQGGGTNLTPGGVIGRYYDYDKFVTTLRTGVTPTGKKLDPEVVPWKSLGQMTDEEMMAVWLYLQTLPNIPATDTPTQTTTP